MNDVAKFTQSIAFNLQVNTISFSSTVDDALTGDTTDCSAWCINEQSSSADSNAPDAFNVVTFARPPNDQISCGAMDRTCFCVLWNSTADEEGVVFSFLVENGGIVIFYFVLLVCSLSSSSSSVCGETMMMMKNEVVCE
jgi:hypothetical protein